MKARWRCCTSAGSLNRACRRRRGPAADCILQGPSWCTRGVAQHWYKQSSFTRMLPWRHSQDETDIDLPRCPSAIFLYGACALNLCTTGDLGKAYSLPYINEGTAGLLPLGWRPLRC